MAAGSNARERYDGFSEARKCLFLVALRNGQSVLDACAMVGVSNRTAYNHRNRDPAFARDWRLATQVTRLPAELAAFERGVEGVEEPIYAYGKRVGTRLRHSDAMLRTLLIAEKPNKYGPRAGMKAERRRLAKRIGALEAELAALKAETAAPIRQNVNFVNPDPHGPAAAQARADREQMRGLRIGSGREPASEGPEISSFSQTS